MPPVRMARDIPPSESAGMKHASSPRFPAAVPARLSNNNLPRNPRRYPTVRILVIQVKSGVYFPLTVLPVPSKKGAAASPLF